ncbi:MAG TPA: hypothetical protein VLG44_04960, partial [Chlamydiales bacterium]|nr:hypothetical protein [Chlamydiales bacterium]
DVELGDIIYLNLWYIDWFEKEVHDRISIPYILLTCDVGDWFPSPNHKRLLYDPKLATWFCRNIVFSYHPKAIQIPIGQAERYFPEPEPLAYLLDFITKKPFSKENLLYMNYLPRPWGDRDKIYKLFENESYCFSRNHTGVQWGCISRNDYYHELAASKFVISPLGLETDCLRNWEAMILDCIPIMEHSFVESLFEGLPAVLIHDWTEINEDFLLKKYEELTDRKIDKVFFTPWRRVIEERQASIRNGDSSHSELEATKFPEQDLKDLCSILEPLGPNLIYIGFATPVHALQLANQASFLTKIQLCDLWMDQKTLRAFEQYLVDPTLLANSKKLSFIPYKTFDTLYPNLAKKKIPVFFDFSYYRNSLIKDTNLKNWRHSLLRDLDEFYKQTSPGTLICGNMIHNQYVKEVLEKLSEKYGIKISQKGNFWFFHKDSISLLN